MAVNFEMVAPILASFGGASVIVAAFAHFLGNLWTDRIAKRSAARFDQELEQLRSKNIFALEEFKKRSESELNDRDQFSGISLEVYRGLFETRVETYLKLLKLKNKYIFDMNEDFTIDEHAAWGDAYFETYQNLRTLLIESQLYISNDLEISFNLLRKDAAEYIKEADMVSGYAMEAGKSSGDADEDRTPVYDKFGRETEELMRKVMEQIDTDVRNLRSRIEFDRI